MRKLASLLSMLLLVSVLAFAQTKTVSGTVKDAAGNAVPFATVIETGTNNGTKADDAGAYTISIKPGSTLTISATGYETMVVTPSESGATDASLQFSAADLDEVVVTTAFGVKQSARVTPFSTQVIDAEQIAVIRQPNLNNALAGKIAGVQFRGQSPVALDRDGFLRIRGGSSLGDVAPIYVVDGTIVNSYDINPDDIAELNVLKGANATALFGPRAANGAVVITTKRGTAASGVGIELNQALTFDRVYILPQYQNSYAGGDGGFLTFNYAAGMPAEWQALDGKPYHDFTDDASWGPKMDGSEYIPWYAFIPGHSRSFKTASLTPQPDNARDFWETGITNNTNVNFSKSGKDFNVRVSYTNQSIKGMLPSTSSTRNNLFVSVNQNLGSHFEVAGNVTYSSQAIRGTFNDGYANQSSGSFTQWFHRDLDMNIMRELRGLKTPQGSYASWNLRRNPSAFPSFPEASTYIGNYWYNFFTYFDLLNYKTQRDRLFGDVGLTYKLNDRFKVRATVRKNQLNTFTENIIPTALQESAGQTGVLASYYTQQTSYQEYNYEGLASYNNSFGDFGLNLNAGANRLDIRYRDLSGGTTQGLNIPDLYVLSNSAGPVNNGNYRYKQNANSLFAFGDIEFRKFLSLSGAIRSDWYSTLPANNNQLVSPSVGASFVFSEFTGEALPWLSFGKVFGSWGRKPKTLNEYALTLNYTPNQNLWDGNFLMATPNTLPDPNLVGSLVTTWEAGIDLRFLRNRLGLSATYYKEDNNGEPIPVTVSGVSGFTTKVINAARFHREGIELVANATIIEKKDFNWSFTTTYSYIIDNKVKYLAEGLPNYQLAAGSFGTRMARAFLIAGEQWGMLKGGGIKRNAEGQPLITTNGFSGGDGWYVADVEHEWGSVVPRVNGGFQTFLNYKDFNLGISLDYQVGGKFFSLSEMWGTFSGLLEETAALNDKGVDVREPVSAGGGVHVVGVQAADEKTPVDVYVDAYDYFHQFYYQRIAEPFVHSLTFVKLRELSLGYNIPVRRIGGSFGKMFQAANFSVIARNPWLIYRESKNFDPSEISAVQGEDGQFPGTRSIGLNLRLTF